jgi:hypothetical protein
VAGVGVFRANILGHLLHAFLPDPAADVGVLVAGVGVLAALGVASVAVVAAGVGVLAALGVASVAVVAAGVGVLAALGVAGVAPWSPDGKGPCGLCRDRPNPGAPLTGPDPGAPLTVFRD